MTEYFDALLDSPLFKGIMCENLRSILALLNAECREYGKGCTVLYEGDVINCVGILLSGNAHSIKTAPDGKKVIVTQLNPGSYIGVLLAGSRERRSPVSVETCEDAAVLFIPFDNILSRGDCPQHSVLLRNLIDGVAEKALMLHERVDCLIKPTVRAKVMTYLKNLSGAGRVFTVPFNREEMAEYLDVDRSALSRELSSMKRDGLIDYHKSTFKLIDQK